MFCFYYYADNSSTFQDLASYAKSLMKSLDNDSKERYCFCIDMLNPFTIRCRSKCGIRIVQNSNVNLLRMLNYLNLNNSIKLFNYVPGLGAAWGIENGIKYYTHSDEQIHLYSPHIHTLYHGDESSYFLMTLKKRDGKNYPRKIEKIIYKQLKENQRELLEFWNDTTNGLLPDVNPLNIIVEHNDKR